ncbi:WD40-repeat-containing domain protein [Geopyxis carbonaria]|nr:WD40-repeat-containing domain protein [Geopyxis carbonaria]
MNQYLFARELGNPMGNDLELYQTTHRLTTLEKSEDAFLNIQTCITSLDFDKQRCQSVLAGGADGMVFLWDTWDSTSKPKASIRAHENGVSSILFYPSDSNLFISTSHDKTVKIWDTQEMSEAASFNVDSPVYSAVMAPHAHHSLVAVASQLSTVQLLDLNTSHITHSLFGKTGAGTLAVNWSPCDQHILASGGIDGTCKIWDIRMPSSCLVFLEMENMPKSSVNLKKAHEGAVHGVSWSEDGSTIVTVGNDKRIRVWKMNLGMNPLTIWEPDILNRTCQASNPLLTPLRQSDPQYAFVALQRDIMAIDTDKGNVRMKWSATDEEISTIIYRPDLPGIMFGSVGGQIHTLGNFSRINTGISRKSSKSTLNDLDYIYNSLMCNPVYLV